MHSLSIGLSEACAQPVHTPMAGLSTGCFRACWVLRNRRMHSLCTGLIGLRTGYTNACNRQMDRLSHRWCAPAPS
eukprot:7352104-Pyramimonas_sp.AAC.1